MEEETVKEKIRVRVPISGSGIAQKQAQVFWIQALMVALVATIMIGGYFWYRGQRVVGQELDAAKKNALELQENLDFVLAAFENLSYYRTSFATSDGPTGYLYINPSVYGLENESDGLAYVEHIGWVRLRFDQATAQASISSAYSMSSNALRFIIIRFADSIKSPVTQGTALTTQGSASVSTVGFQHPASRPSSVKATPTFTGELEIEPPGLGGIGKTSEDPELPAESRGEIIQFDIGGVE